MSSAKSCCRVCGDQATGFNYNGLSCESCKVFFHRNSTKIEKLKCIKNDDKCEINIDTRKCCSKCRMDKCLTVGMVRQFCDKTNKQNCSVSDKFLGEYFLNQLTILKENNRFDEQSNIIDQICSRKKRHATDLTLVEREHIATIERAISVFDNEYEAKIVRQARDMIDVINMPELYVRKSIEFARSFPTFSCLNQADQLLILKPFCFEILSIRFCFLHSFEQNGFPMIIDEQGTEAIFIHRNTASELKCQDLVRSTFDYSDKLKLEMEDDFTIRNLLSVQFLFRPREQLTCREYIKYHYCIHTRLLHRYLEHKYKSKLKADQKYAKLMSLMELMDQAKEDEIKLVCSEFERNEIPQMIIELYNLTI